MVLPDKEVDPRHLCLFQQNVPAGYFGWRAAPNASNFPEVKHLEQAGSVMITLVYSNKDVWGRGYTTSYELCELPLVLHSWCCGGSEQQLG